MTTAPPPPSQVVRGPDGKLRTITAPPRVSPEDLARAHRETLDRIEGNEKFHEDPFTVAPQAAAPAPAPGVQCPFCGVIRAGENWHCDSPPTFLCPNL